MLNAAKSVKPSAKGHRIIIPIQLIARLMLKVLDCAECLLARTTDKAEVAADNIAKDMPSMPFHVRRSSN
jgi:hypothetical protein